MVFTNNFQHKSKIKSAYNFLPGMLFIVCMISATSSFALPLKSSFLVPSTMIPKVMDDKDLNENNEPEKSKKAQRILSQYRKTGETTGCISSGSINKIIPLDKHHFLIRASNSKYYLNVVGKGCNRAARVNHRLEYGSSKGRVCEGDVISFFQNAEDIFIGSCNFGEFQALEKIKKLNSSKVDR